MLHRALDGEMSESETRVFRRRLRQDERIRAEYEELKKVVRDTKAIRAAPPSGFKGRVMRKLEDASRAGRRG